MREGVRAAMRQYPCACGARPGQHCRTRSGIPDRNVVHMDRVRKYYRDQENSGNGKKKK